MAGSLFFNHQMIKDLKKTGVSKEFMQEEVVTRIEKLLEQLDKLLSLRKDNIPAVKAASVLRNSLTEINSTLIQQTAASNTEEAQNTAAFKL